MAALDTQVLALSHWPVAQDTVQFVEDRGRQFRDDLKELKTVGHAKREANV